MGVIQLLQDAGLLSIFQEILAVLLGIVASLLGVAP